MNDKRVEHEIAHGKVLRESWSGKLWYWETPAGKRRWRRRVVMLTGHIRPGMRVLEIGCGMGYFTKEIAKLNCRVTAIDISPDLLNVAQANVKCPNVTFKLENAYNLSFADTAFDTIIGSSVLHHLDIRKSLKEFHRALCPGGTLYFTEPNMANPQIFLQKNISFFKKMAGDSPDETAFLRGPTARMLEEHGFTDIRIEPFDFLHPLTPCTIISAVESVGTCLERLPLIREIAGSLYIRANKP